MVFEELNVNIGADTADFSAGANRVEEGLDNVQREALLAASAVDVMGESIDDAATDALTTAAAMQTLANRTDNAGDQATQTSTQFSILSGATNVLGTQVPFLNASLGTTIGLFSALLVVLTPVVAGLGALVGIVGAIGLTGFVGGLLAVTQNTQRLKRELELLVNQFTTAFAPVTEEATQVLTRLAQQFRRIIPALVPAGSEIDTIGQAFEQLGLNIINSLPAFTQAVTTLTADFLPAIAGSSQGIVGFAQDVRNFVQSERFSNLVNNLIAGARELAPELGLIATNLAEFTSEENIKGITTLIDGLLDIVVVITEIANALSPVLEGIAILGNTFGGIGTMSGTPGAADFTTTPVGDVAQPGSQNPYSNANRGDTNVTVEVAGDTGVIDERATRVIEERERATLRGTGGSTRP